MMAVLMTLVAFQQASAPNAKEEVVRLATTAGTLEGTLLLPANATGRLPVALIIAGSGPTDRNGNTPMLPGQNNSLKLIAEALAERGIASLRYDKRGIGSSMSAAKSESELRFDTYIDDAAAWVEQLRKDNRFSTVTVIGHSEGSLIGIKAAQKVPIDALVSIAGPGRPLHIVIAEQLQRNAPPELTAEAVRVMKELTAGRTVSDVPQSLQMLFRPSVQPYLISQLSIDPAVEIARVKVPVLIVQGTTDIQAAITDADALAKGNPRARLAMIDGMNHVLKEVREASQQMASYSDSKLPLHAELAPTVTAFVLSVRR